MSAISIANLDIWILLKPLGKGGDEGGMNRPGRTRRVARSLTQGIRRIFRPGSGGRRTESIRDIIRDRG